MSLFQNFKEADYTFEKNFFKAIFGIALCITFFFLIEKVFDKIPDIKKLFVDNSKYFQWFLFCSIIIFFISFITYFRSLDAWEAETEATISVSIKLVVLWTFFWLLWSSFCAWLTLNFSPMTLLVKFAIIGLVIIPGFTGFLVSFYTRQQDLKQLKEDEKLKRANHYNYEPFTICIDRKYYSGYYGLLCLPFYLVALLIGHFL